MTTRRAIAWLPGDHYVYEDERLDVTGRERRRQIVGTLVATFIVLAFIVGPLAIGGFILNWLGL